MDQDAVTCQKPAAWDVEIRRTGAHLPICEEHRTEAAVMLSRKGELLLRASKDPKAACIFVFGND